MPNQQKPELIELLINSEIIPTANDDYVNLINPERPQGFAEHFAQLLSRTPNIHSPNKPEFFPHLFLGSVAALPYTDLMSKLKIEKIFFDIKKKKGSLKLVFKIKDQTGYKLKLFIVTDNKSAVSFTDQELSDIKSKTSDSKNLVADAPTQIEYHVLRILKDDGFKLQVSSEDIREKFSALGKTVETEESVVFQEITKKYPKMQQFGPLVDKLSSAKPEDVKASLKTILKSLKNLYIGQKDKLADLKSEAANHGFIHGFFAFNYKYTNCLDCYSEQIAGIGFPDFRLLSHHDSKGQVNSNPFSITLEMKDGGGAESGIAQLKDSGYAYISPNVRTEAEKVIIAALDWSKEDNVQDLKVEIVDVHKVKESLVARLIDDIQHGESTGDIVRNIREQMKSLYYSFSLKHKDSQYCSRVLVGQSISLEKQGIESFFFRYSGTITGGTVTTLLYKDGTRGIALNILEVQDASQQIALHLDDGIRTRPKPKPDKVEARTPGWYMIPVQSLGIDDFITLQIVVNTNAASFEKKEGKQGYIESIDLLKVKIDAIAPLHQGDFVPLSKVAVSDIIFSMFDHPVTNVDENLPTASKRMKLGEVEKKQEKHQKVDVEKMLKQCFANLDSIIIRESDVQAILHGFLLGQKYLDQHIRVFIEQSYGPGKSDVVAFIPDKHNSREERVLLFETKICKLRSSTALQELFVKATLQLSEYQQHLKSSTDSKKVSVIPLIYNRADKAVYVHQFNGVIDHTSHSSSAEQGPTTNNQNYKQGHKSVIASPEILSEMFEKGIFDFSKYHLDTIDYILLKNFLIHHRPEPQLQVTCVLNLSNQRNIIDNMDIVAEILQHDLWIRDLIMKNCALNKDALTRLTNALISKERLEVAMNGSPAQKAYLLQDTSSGGLKVLGLRVSDLSGNVMSVQCSEILSRALSQMLSLESFAVSRLENAVLQHIYNGLMQSTTLLSLKIVKVQGGLDTERAQGLVVLFNQHPNLQKLYASHNSMGQSNIDIILQGAQKKGRKFEVCDLSYNKKDAQEVINTESLKSFISFYKETLETLKWSGNGLGDQGLNDLSPSFKESNIKVLALSHNKIKEINGDQLPRTLTGLIISHNKITSFIRGESKHLENLVDTLDITYNPQLSNVCDVMNLAIVAHTKHLGLSGIDFGNDFHVTAFNELWRYGEDLTSLSVPNCNMGDHEARILFDRIELPLEGGVTKLKKLNCEDNNIEISDARVISGRPSKDDATGFIIFSDSIEEVSFKNNKIGNKGGKHLLDALQARSNQQDARAQRNVKTEISIDLSKNLLTDEFAKDLASKVPLLKDLKSLKLRGNTFGTAIKNQLVNALGNNGNTDITNLEIDGLAQDEKLRLDSYLIRNAYRESLTSELRLNADGHFEVTSCLNSGRSKRFINGCKISWDDVDEISREKTRDKEKIVIDAEKFLKYSKQHVDDIEKSKQLLSLANEIKSEDSGRIVGKHQNILDQVIKTGDYKQYVENDRINYLGSQALIDNNIMPKLKAKLVNGIGRIQMGYGAYGTFVSCQQAKDRPDDLDSNLDCILGVTEIGYSSLSHVIEQKISSKIANHVVAHKILGAPLAKSFAGSIAKGGVEIGSAAFDIEDIIRSSIALSKCNDKSGSESACSEKEIRDNIASISFSSVSMISGIVLFAAGAGSVLSVGVGAVIFVVRIIYGGISNVVEYSQKYYTTDAENWSIFWRTALFQDMASDVKALSGRQDNVDMAVKNAWKILQNSSEEIVGISLGLGPEDLEYVNECVKKPSIDMQLNPFTRIQLDGTSINIQLGFDITALFGLVPIPNPNNVHCTQYTRFNFKPAVSRIDMSHKDDHIPLSRVQPHNIDDAKFVCLPKITKAEYEKGLSKFNNETVFKCDNAAVILHKQRYKTQSTTDTKKKQAVLYYLKEIISGSVVGSLEYNNYFLIFGGNATIFAPSVPYNTFQLFQNDYSGTIHLSANSTNVVDLSGFETIQNVRVEYNNIISLTIQMLVTIDGTTSHFDALEKGVEIRYVGGEKTLDTITCDVQSYNKQDTFDSTIVINSGGVIRNISGWRDLITNCRTVVLSPNTIVQGTGGGYSIYINKVNKKIGLFDSVIDIPDGANIIFAISLFEDCGEIKYSSLDNNLNIHIPLPQGGEYKISLSQYMKEDKTTNYVLMHQNGARIIPSLDSSNTAVKNFLLRKDIEENFTALHAVYYDSNDILYKGKGYNISGIIVYKGDAVCMFGSITDDLIIENDNIVLMSGGEGRDLYTINNNKKDELYIYNYAEDLKLDFLTIPSIKNLIVRIHAADVELRFGLKNIILLDYLIDKEYQHIVIIDHELKTVIPLYEGSGKISLQPFYYPLESKKNIYVLSNDDISGVIGIHSKDIGYYKQGNDLLITDKRKPFGILNIILENYYIKDARSTNIALRSYDNGEVGNVIDLNSIVLSHTDTYISNVYGDLVQEHIVDLQEKSSVIAHNNELSTCMIVLQNTSLDDLSVIHNNSNDLTIHSSVSNNSLVLKDWWYISAEHTVTAFEFDTGITPIRVWVSNDFQSRIDLNHQINTEIVKIDALIVKAVLSFVTAYNKSFQRPSCGFLEEELSKFGGIIQSVADIKRSLESTDDMSGKVLMLLLAKFANRILLEDPNMGKEEIYEFSDVCFGTIVSSTEIKGVVQLVNSSIVYNDIESVVTSRKHQMQYIMLNLPLTVNNNEEHIISHHRDTRDITKSTDDDYRMPYSVDKADSRSFIESTYWFKEYIDNMTSEYY